MNLKKRLAYIPNLDVVRRVQVLLGLLALGLFATGARADLATYFDESTMPTNLFLDVPNTSVGTITLQSDLSRLLLYGPGRDIWSSRNGVPFAWTPVPGVGIGGSWEAETEVEYGDTNAAYRIAGMTLYSGPDGAGGSNYGQEFTFGLDQWDTPKGVWVQGLGDNRPGDSGNLNIPLTANKVTLRMVVSRGSQNYHTYNFYYRLTTNDTWSSVGTIHHTAAFSRVALFCKVNNTGSTIMMNVAFNHFLVTPLSLGQNYAYTTNANNTITITEYAGSDSTLVIPDQIEGRTVSGIGNNAFYNCRSLTNVTIPSGVTTIGDNAFYNCSSLANVTIPSGVTTIGSYAFFNCSSLTNVTIPSGVTTIANYMFYNCTSLTNVTIPSGVTTIGNQAFGYCYKLTNVVIPDSVTTLGTYLFWCCTTLASVTLPDALTTLPNDTFGGCTSLTTIELPNTLTTIGDTAFAGCSSLTNVVFPDSVTTLGTYLFNSCTCLTTVTLPKGRTTIPTGIFYNCTSLTNVIIPAGVTMIEDNAFASCTALTTVELPNTLTTIKDYAFYNCASLPTIVIPNSITTLGAAAFSACTAFTTITLPNGLTMISDSCFSGCSSLTNVVIPSSVTSIGYSAFDSCTALTRITIPDTVTSVSDSAFFCCVGLTSATLPSSLTYLPSEIFGYCFSLRAVYFQGNAPGADWSAFDYDSDIIFYYRPSTTGWEDLSANTGYPARLWNPTIQAGTQGFGPHPNGYYFNISGAPDIPIQVEACTNLTHACWEPLLTTTLSNGSLDFTDASSTNFPVRFYRIIGP